MRTIIRSTVVALVLALGLVSSGVAQAAQPETKGQHAVQNKSGGHGHTQIISYHGGPLIQGGVNVYYIWYGTWSGSGTPAILTDLASSIGGSSYYNINTTYYDGAGIHVPNAVHYGGSASQSAPYGSALSDAGVQSVVAGAINSGGLPLDPNGVYFVLTSADIQKSGFLTSYCGWHTNGVINGQDIKYSFVGDAGGNSGCSAQQVTPNGNVGADSMASVIAHELEEANTDPDLNAWYDRQGQENADKCAWTFGSTTTLGSGAKYNVTFGSRNYLIQQNWVNQGNGFCAKSF